MKSGRRAETGGTWSHSDREGVEIGESGRKDEKWKKCLGRKNVHMRERPQLSREVCCVSSTEKQRRGSECERNIQSTKVDGDVSLTTVFIWMILKNDTLSTCECVGVIESWCIVAENPDTTKVVET